MKGVLYIFTTDIIETLKSIIFLNMYNAQQQNN